MLDKVNNLKELNYFLPFAPSIVNVFTST